MIEGSRTLPTRHVSVRVPWHDTGWDGTVCRNPKANSHCLVLKRIGQSRDDEAETLHKEEKWDEDGQWLPACADERAGFMTQRGYVRRANHPYVWQELYAHFRETSFHHRPFSVAPIPFGWMLRNTDGTPPTPVEQYELGFYEDYEPDLKGFTSRWVQERRNQLVLLDTFFGALKPSESLIFFYAKKTPLSDDPRRVLLGVGRVTEIEEHVEYKYADDVHSNALRCVLWERNVHHSIRNTFEDGLILPYHALTKLRDADPEFDFSPYIVHVPEELWDAFSMGAEHVSHDQAVSVLILLSRTLERVEKLLPGEWDRARRWVNERLNRIWTLRGPFPGLGAALTACGIANGTLIAYAIGEMLKETDDPWPTVEKILHQPTLLPDGLGATLGPNTAQLWNYLKESRRIDLLKLLARFALSEEQAQRWFDSERSHKLKIDVSDAQILANPYLLYENDRASTTPVSFGVVDRGLFPDKKIRAAHPIPPPSACTEPLDRRRGRALCVRLLEDAAAVEGHSLLPQSWLTKRAETADVEPACPITPDWLAAFSDQLGPDLKACTANSFEPATGQEPAWQLQRYSTVRDVIGTQVRKRLKGKLHGGAHDWRKLIDDQLPALEKAPDREREEKARAEKARALEIVFRHRISVLIGPAGTGKTTLLAALLTIPSVNAGGVLLLAPTGKARVQMQKRSGQAEAQTLAQFLLEYDRYAIDTQRYSVTFDSNRERAYKTVVIDECSMLTEDQLAATFDALAPDAVERIIMVGDPRQLPPIGAGRPFVDVIRWLNSQVDPVKPPIPGMAELTVLCRQTKVGETEGVAVPIQLLDDVTLAQWFASEAPDPGADEVWDKLKSHETHRIELIEWETPEDLQKKLIPRVIDEVRRVASERGYSGRSDEENLEISFGGIPYEHGGVFFNPSRINDEGLIIGTPGAGPQAERWQILSPIRATEVGVDSINRRIQRDFRKRALRIALPEKPWQRKTAKPLGSQGILYGDKVINVANSSRRRVYPKKRSYVANGEIGIVVGQYRSGNIKMPWKHEVEFSTQAGYKYDYGSRDFGDEGDSPLELAYALTIHKSQGSEFESTFVVVPNPCRPLSRELLYTALTRQKHHITLFHQGDVRRLMNLSSAQHSETARRLTNLFFDPAPFEYGRTFLEGGLVHRTSSGRLMRSKSEVIVANVLERLGLGYEYELRFDGNDGKFRVPDFTVNDAASGRCVIIEHLGMLDDTEYRRRWERKLAWYQANGVSPYEHGEGERATLVTTSEVGGIDIPQIEGTLRTVFGL